MKNKYVAETHFKIYKKYLRSKIIYIFLNITLFIFFSCMTFVSIYAIRKNPFPNTKIYFVITTILSSLLTLLTSIFSLTNWNKKPSYFKEKICKINSLQKKYKGEEKMSEIELFERVNEINVD